jgi:hypothetical protein
VNANGVLSPRLPNWSSGVWVLLADQVLTNTGFFMLFPLLTVHLTRDLGWVPGNHWEAEEHLLNRPDAPA